MLLDNWVNYLSPLLVRSGSLGHCWRMRCGSKLYLHGVTSLGLWSTISWKRCSWWCNSVKSKASVHSICSMVGLGLAQHLISSSPSVYCRWGSHGCGLCGWVWEHESLTSQEPDMSRKIAFVQKLMYLKYSCACNGHA